MQWTDPAARELGQQFSNLSLGGGFAGPIAYDQAFYNFSYQLGRNARDYQTLTNTRRRRAAGAPAWPRTRSRRLLSLLGQQHIPASAGGIPNERLVDNGLVFGAIDFAPPSSTTGQAFNLTFNAGWNRQDPLFGGVTDVPARSGDRTSWNGALMGRHTNFIGYFLSETSFGVQHARTAAGSPYVNLPAGSVRVNSEFDDGTSSVRTLGFGGSPMASTSQSTLNVAFNNALSWFSMDNKHRFKLTTELRRDGYSQDQTHEPARHVHLQLARPTSRRTRRRRTRAACRRARAREARSWARCRSATRTGSTRTSSCSTAFALTATTSARRRTGTPPSSRCSACATTRCLTGSTSVPRIGFSWTVGTAAQVAAFDGAVRGPRAVVRGGVGFFQNSPGTQLIGGAIDNTGLASGVQQLNCVGPATPIPDWDLYLTNPSAAPTTCADGSTGNAVRQHRAERLAVRQGLPVAEEPAVEPELERGDPEQPVHDHARGDVLAEHEPAELRRPQLQPASAVHAA